MDKKQLVNLAAGDLAETMPMLARNLSVFAEKVKDMSRVVGEVLMSIQMTGSTNITELSHRLHRPKSNLTPIIDKLVTDGLVVRNQDENDRRIIHLQLTPQGEAAVVEIKNQFKGHIAHMLEFLEDAEVEEFYKAIKVVRNSLQKISRGLEK